MGREGQIAVIGMACRLPGGADDPESLWSLLARGRDGRSEVPKDRWNWKSFYHKNPDIGETTNFSHAYFLKQDISAFDARFFGILGAEATGMDPQQRLLLEVTYEAAENAGIPIESFRGSNTSVHIAMFARDYDRMGYRDVPYLHKTHVIGSGEAILANRISYVWDLKGTSNTLDTGCSGGLVALHQACRTLRADESDLALAGASQLLLTPDQSMAMSQLTNADGRCYTFDDRGHGYARGEGLGVLLLKRLDRALADSDNIHAIIVDSGSNHDGKTVGIFVPNADAQEALAKSVYAKAGLDPRETLYVEAHGTGTVAGDNAEVESISKVFGREAGRISDVPVGSVKTNIGHLEAASGVASMIKAIMVLKKNQIPPQLNFINPKPSLHLEERGIHVPVQLEPLAPEGHVGPRRVSVNSFGYGGTNAHAILEAYDNRLPTNGHINGYTNGHSNGHDDGHDDGIAENIDDKARLIVLSANSELSLDSLRSRLRHWLETDQGHSASFADLVYTLNVRRSQLPWRSSVVASNIQELGKALDEGKTRPVKSGRDVATAFVFTGQGAQWFAMGRELLSGSREFASSIALCSHIMKDAGCVWDLVEELSRDKTTSRLSDAIFSQPCTTIVQIALVDLLKSFGILPETVCGHSSGEIAAAYAAGALSREAAVQVAYNRGIYSSMTKDLNAPTGAMLAVGEGEETINKRIQKLDRSHGKVTVACVNSPESTTISGDLEAILELQGILDSAFVFNRRLKVDSAYHSHHMEVVAQSYLSSLEDMSHGIPRKDVAFYSSVTGARKESNFGPSYWVSNLVSQVKFSAASKLVAEHLAAASSTANNVVIEVGPHSALSGPLRQTLSSIKLASAALFKYIYVSCLVRNESAMGTTLALVGKIFELGGSVQLDAVTNMGAEKPDSNSRGRIVGNLPPYPWDHSSSYWHESRLSKDYRLRPFPSHDLLGLFDVHSSPQEPRWRYNVSLESFPWLRDHVVEGFVIFPGMGYLIMVIEAMKQMFQLRKTPGCLLNINFRNVSFTKAVVVPDEAAKDGREVELHLTITPSRQHAGTSWENFRVLSYDPQDGSWIENCTGLTKWDSDPAEDQAKSDDVAGTRDDGLGHLTNAGAAEMFRDYQAKCDALLDAAQIYRDLSAAGNEYGPSFQGLNEIRVTKNQTFAKIVIEDIAQQMPGQYMQPHTIHPTTFDSIIQLVAVMFRRECTIAPIMPISLGELSIAVDMHTSPGSEIFVAFHFLPQGRREAIADFCAYQKQSDGTLLPVITANGLRPQAVGDGGLEAPVQKKTTYRLEWKLDVDYVTQDGFMEHIARENLFDVSCGEVTEQSAETQLLLNDTVAAIFIRRTVQRIQEQGISTALSPHLSKLISWMLRWDKLEAGRLLEGVTSEHEAKLIEQVSRSSIIGEILNSVGPQYTDLFTGKASAVELLAQNDMLRRLYSEHILFTTHYAQVAEYMQLLVFKNPYMKIMEIDAGTAGVTTPLMKSMERDDRLLLDEYTYINTSSGSFERARSKFNKWESQIQFKTLDISRDPVAQGYPAYSFDAIVASMELHTTPQMDVTLTNVRKLLKPGGRLILVELTAVTAAHNATFGTLASWWMSEDGCQDGPLLSVSEWDDCLKRNGFSGNDLAIPAHRGQSGNVSTMIITRAAAPLEANSEQVAESAANIHLGNSDATQFAIRDSLYRRLSNNGIRCSRESWSPKSVADFNGITIVIDSAEYPLLLDPSPQTFEQIKQLMLQGRRILWASFQCSLPSGETAAMKNMINGMARVIRRENPDLQLVTVDVHDQIHPSETIGLEHITKTLTEIVVASWLASEGSGAEESEYAIRHGKVTVPRVVPDERFAGYLDSLSPGQDNCDESVYLNKARPLMLDVRVPGLLNTIRFVDNDKMAEPLGADQVEIQARAHGLNLEDVSVALGRSAPGTEMLGEVAGVVTAVGSNVRPWKTGDRVVGLLVAPFGNQVRVNSKGIVAIPDSVTFTDAASIPWAHYTAWYCLTQVARLEKGQSVLIHAASGGVGQAAIQLAKIIGAEIFTTVGSADKKKLIREHYGISDSHIFSSRNFKKHILETTQDVGVDIVLNSLAGQLLMDSWDCVAQFGTFVEIGKADIHGRSQLNMANFEKQVTFTAVDPSQMYRLRPASVTRGLTKIFAMVDQGLLRPVHPVTIYPMTRIEETFRIIAARKHVGKIVLVADEQTLVQATRPKATPLRLHQDGTYVIGGGLGDLGKKIGCFLAERGAGHIVALTRRKLDAQQRAPLEEDISRLGGTLRIVKCDINDETSTRAAAEEIARLPPVRGVIQSATVLADHPLEYMKLEDWTTAVNPKVHGTLNIHKVFCSAEATEFFVMLSSVASVFGSSSQSNYAAGNAFLDAFAHTQSQYSRGITNYITINVGAVEGSGLIAQAQNQHSEFVRAIGSVSIEEVLDTLEYAMKPQARVDEARQCLMPFSRDSMEDSMGPEAMSDHIFDHVPNKTRQGEKATTSVVDNKKPSVLQLVEHAETLVEAQDIVKQALLDKFTAFTGEDIPDDQPIAVLGLDSLVSIELKNWVKHTFQTPLQTSELMGASNIIAFARVIVSRMEIKCEIGSDSAAKDEENQESAKPSKIEPRPERLPDMTVRGRRLGNKFPHTWDCCKLHDEVPAQPLPDLDDSLDFWLEANGHLFSLPQLQSIHKDIEAMRLPNSPARRILQDTFNVHAHDKSNGWFTDIVTEGRFLCNRAPIAPGSSIMGGYRETKMPHSQAEQGAIIALAVLSFKGAMSAGVVQPLDIGGKPECTWAWKWLLNSTRVPRVNCDKMVSYASQNPNANDHIAVLRKGRVFKVKLQEENGKVVSFQQLQATFEAIVERVKDDGVWSGILTSDERDSWAKIRESLSALSPRNAQYFQVIDSAMFVLCLDAGSPDTPDEIARQGFIGDGMNRWFDKVLQFYVSANGRSGQIQEHGIIDGTTPARLMEWIATAMATYSTNSIAHNIRPNGNRLSGVEVEEVVLQTTSEIDSHIEVLRERFLERTSASTYVREELHEFGTDFLVKSRAPVKGVIDITFQLAIRLFFGRNMISWEPTSAAHFHKGRSDAVQRATPAVNAFCDAAVRAYQGQEQVQPSTPSELRVLLLAATKQTKVSMQSMLKGRSYLRVFEVLSYLWPSDASTPKPRFLSEHVFFGRPHPPIFAQSNVLESDIIVEDFVHLLSDTDGFWSFMIPEKNKIRVSLTGGSGQRTAAFVNDLHRAAIMMRDIVKLE